MTELLNTLYVQTPGTSLHLDGDTVRIWHPDQPTRRILPLARIDHIVVFSGATITDDLLLRCADDGRSVSWLTGNGRLRGRVVGPTTGNPLLRQAQHRAHDDPTRRLPIARAVVAGKIHNTRQVLLRAARDATGARQERIRATAERHAELLPRLAAATSTDEMLGVEGTAARDYFATVPDILTTKSGTTDLPGRRRRPPTDPVNCLLSFTYGLLRVAVHGALDPYLGYLHGIRPGKPALALDIMEEFRPLIADRLVFTMLNRQELQPAHFEHLPGGAVRLTDDGRRTVLTAWQHARAREWPHRQLRRPVTAALLPIVQARLLARHLRGDTDAYLPWTVN
jgi:CRISP-associated protein Cas1